VDSKQRNAFVREIVEAGYKAAGVTMHSGGIDGQVGAIVTRWEADIDDARDAQREALVRHAKERRAEEEALAKYLREYL